MIKKLFSNTFFRGSLLFTAASFAANIFSYIFNLIVARAVPVSDYGEYSSSLSYFFLLSVPMTALSMIVIKKVGQVQPQRRKAYARTLERWLYHEITKNFLQILSAGTLFGLFLWRFSNLQPVSIFFILIMASTGVMFMFYQSVLQANKWFLLSGIFVISGALIKLIGGGVLWITSPNLIGIYFSVLSSVFVTLVVTAIMFRRASSSIKTELIAPDVFSYLLKREIYIPVITLIGVTALVNVDVMIVKKFFTAEEAGLYGGISLLGRIILYISSPVSAVAYTFFTGHESENQSRQVLILSSAGLLVLAVLSSLAYYLFPHVVVGVIFGNKYQSINQVIWLSAVFGSMYGFISLYSQYLMAKLTPLSMLALPIAGVQFLSLFLFHGTFSQVLTINIICSGALIMCYIYSIWSVRTVLT